MSEKAKGFFSITGAVLIVFGIFFSVFAYSLSGENFISFYKSNSFFYLMSGLILIGGIYLLLSYIRCRKILTWNIIDSALLAWVSYVLLNYSFKNGSFGNDRFITIISCTLSYFIVRIFLSGSRSGKFITVLAYGILMTSILQSLTGLLQFYGVIPSLNESFAVTGTFKNPAPFSLFISACFPVSLAIQLFLRGKKFKGLKRVSFTSLVMCILVLPLTGIRSAWISAIVSSIFVLEVKYNLRRKVSTLLKKSGTRKLIFSSFLFCLFLASSLALYRMKALSADSRVLVWQITADKFLQEPFFGVGYNNFSGQYSKWQVEYFKKNPGILEKNYFAGKPASYFAGYVKMAYNEYLEIAVEQGVLGLGAFLCLLIVVLLKLFRSLNNRASILLVAAGSGFIGLLVAGFTSYPFYSLPTFFAFFIFMAFISSDVKKRASFLHQKQRRASWFQGLLSACGFILIGITLFTRTVANSEKYLRYQRARNLYLNNNTGLAEQDYAEVFKSLKGDPAYLLDYGACLLKNRKIDSAFKILSLAGRADSDPRIYFMLGNILKERKQFLESENMYQFAHLTLPSRIYPKYLLANLYMQEKDTARAVAMARDILYTPVKGMDQLGENIIKEMERLLQDCGRRPTTQFFYTHPLFNN